MMENLIHVFTRMYVFIEIHVKMAAIPVRFKCFFFTA